MAKLSLTPAPTFKAKVGIPVPGADSVPVEFTFKWRTRDEAKAWAEETAQFTDAELIPTMATAWDLDDAFTPENCERLCQAYMGAGQAITTKYLAELKGAREKN